MEFELDRYAEEDYFEYQMKLAQEWAQNISLRSKRPERNYPIDTIDIGLISKCNTVEELMRL